MNDHSNVDTVNRMTKAIFDQDHDTLASIFTDDLVFHLRGPHSMAGDHRGLGGFLGVLGSFFEMTGGRIVLDQQFCVGADGWAAEWEHATLGRNGKTLESPRCGCSSACCPSVPRPSSPDYPCVWTRLANWCEPSRKLGRPATATGGVTPGGCCRASRQTL